MRTTLWRYHLGGGCALALAYVSLPFPPLRIAALVALCLATIAATLASVRLWSPARRLPFHLFAAGEAVGFVAGSLGSSAAVTRAGGSVAAAALTCVAYLIGIAGYALLIRTRSPGRDHAGLIDATMISTGVGMLAWVFLASPYSVDHTLPLVERALLVLLGAYDPASPVEAGWLVAYALWGAAVLHPSVATLTDPVPAPRIGLTRGRLASLAGASLMAPAILAIQALRGQRIDVPVIVGPGQGPPQRRRPGRAVRRPGRLQGGQRQPRSRRRRPAAARGRGPAAQLPARPRHRWPPGRGRARHPGRGRRPGHGPPARRAGHRHPGRALPPGRRAGHHPRQHRHRLRRAAGPGRGPAAAQRRHRHVRRQEPRQGQWSTTSRSSTCTPAGSPGPRPWSAGPGPTGAGPPGRVHPPGRGDRPGGRARPVRAPPGLPPGGRLGRRRRPPAAARQPLRPPPAPQRPGRHVAAALRDSGLPPECLALELTESVLMHDLAVAVVRLHELKRLGVGLATTLHLDTVAEGVERPEQATALAELGCHLAQGYHFSRPIPAADMARLTGQHPVATTLSHLA